MASKKILRLWKEYIWTARALPENSRRREVRIGRFYVKNPAQPENARIASLRYALRNLEKTIQFIKYRGMKRRYEHSDDLIPRVVWEKGKDGGTSGSSGGSGAGGTSGSDGDKT